jgi:hypothetical protein
VFHDGLVVMVWLGIPASAISLVWWARDAVRWVRSRSARPSSGSAGTPGSEQSGAAPPRTSTARGGER